MSVRMKKTFSKEMQNLDAAGLLRTETPVEQTGSMEARFRSNKSALNFIGNDLLGWSSNDQVREAATEALARYGTGSTSSRVCIGTLDVTKILEEKLSDFLGLDDCIVFPSNYLANIGVFDPLTNRRDKIFIDEMSSPGLYDGARLSRAEVVSYEHNDNDNLEYHLKCSQNSRFRLVVTDGVFNTDGECANLDHIQELTEAYDAITIVDDSFGVGILGENGRGTFDHLQVEKKAEITTGSFAYALGNVGGGFICGDGDLVHWLRHTSKPYILSEPMSPINAAIVLKAIEILEKDPSVIAKLHSNALYLKEKILVRNWELITHEQPFISIVVGSTLKAQKTVEYLFDNNILVSGLCYPNTPEDASRLRINVCANHTTEQMDKLIISLEEAFSLLG